MVDIKAVSEMLGHADVTITLKIYHHVDAKAIKQMHRVYSPICMIASNTDHYTTVHPLIRLEYRLL